MISSKDALHVVQGNSAIQLSIPRRLYGRDREVASLLGAFEKTCHGHGEVLLVPGNSGVGKTALVQQVQDAVTDKNGWFAQGKFNQYQQNTPYLAVKQALSQLWSEMRCAEPAQIDRCQSEISEVVGDQGHLLVDLVPELTEVFGAQSPAEEISPQEAQHQFAGAIRRFLSVACQPDHPVVLFIDDWQWADMGSLELLRQLQVGTTLQYLMLIISYRDEEVGATHPLISTVTDLRRQAVPVEVLEVRNLSIDDVQALVTGALKPSVKDLNELTELIHHQTQGNPFYVRAFLEHLYDSELLWLDRAQGCWCWKSDQRTLPADVVDLFVRRLHNCDQNTQTLLSRAACLGNRFDTTTLATVCAWSAEECHELLHGVQMRGLILPIDHQDQGDSPDLPSLRSFMFMHDRVQQAAFLLIEPSMRAQVRLEIGWLLRAHLGDEELDDRLFEVLEHLNAGHSMIRDPARQIEMVKLNVTAAHKSRSATAYTAMLQFYRAAGRFVEETPGGVKQLWSSHYELALELFNGWAQSEFLEGDISTAEMMIQQVVTEAKTAIERAASLNILIVNYTLLARYPEAIAAARQALNELGILLPEDDYEAARDAEIASMHQLLDGRSVASLIDSPIMSDPEMCAASKLLITMGPPCYRMHQRLWSVIVPKVVNLTLRYGLIPQIGYSHTAFGGLLGWVANDYETAKEFGDLATRVMATKFESPSDQSVFYLMIGSSTRHWFTHLKHASADYLRAYEIGLHSGNLQYAAYAFGHNMYCSFYQGIPLADLIRETRQSLVFSRTRLNHWAIDLLEGGLRIFDDLCAAKPAIDGVGSTSEETYLQQIEGHDNIQVKCIYQVLKTFALLLLGRHQQALSLSDETEPLIYTVGTQGLLPWPEHVLARLLILTALYPDADANLKAEWQPGLKQSLNQLRIWADYGAENYSHKYLLAAAEMARIDDRSLHAIQLYDQAIEAASSSGFLQWEGMANERASRFWLARGNTQLGQVYWQQAYNCYSRWGATCKVHAMETEYLQRLLIEQTAGAAPAKLVDVLDLGTRESLFHKHIELLRLQTKDKSEARLRVLASKKAEELAQATDRLREEIAQRKKAEQSLQTSEARFKTIFTEAPLGIALINSFTGHIYEVNPRFAEIAGRTTKEMTTIDWMSLTHPDDRQEDIDNMALLNAGEISGFNMKKRYIRPDGTAVWINMTIAPVKTEQQDEPLHLCMIDDINDRMRTEEELLKMAKLESLGILAGGIAHDLNNFLTGLVGNIGLAKEFDDPVEKAERLERAENDAMAIKDLTQQLLTFAKGGSPDVKLIDCGDLLTQTVNFTLSGSNIRCDWYLPDDSYPARIDKGQIAQVINNLIINAQQAMPEGGTIKVSAEKIELGKASNIPVESGPYVKISVEDKGVGIPKEARQRIFDPFFSTKPTGNGLGLATAYSIMQKHNGTILVESELGVGTKFEIYLPASVEKLTVIKDKEESEQPTGESRILVMDDQVNITEILDISLSRLGYEVATCTDGAEALAKYKDAMDAENSFNAVILDLTIPGGMGGGEAIKKLKEIDPGVRAIVASGYSDDPIMMNHRDYGFIGAINKPYKIRDLRKLLHQVLNEKKPVTRQRHQDQ